MANPSSSLPPLPTEAPPRRAALQWQGFDGALLLLGGLMLAGVLLVQTGVHRTSANQVEGQGEVLMTLHLRTRTTMPDELFKTGEMTHITVRNQPRGAVRIESVKRLPAQVLIPLPNGTFNVEDDPTQADVYDIRLVLRDKALKTKEGYVAEGVKLKVGLPIELEGFNYRLSGGIVGLAPAPASTTTPTTPSPAAKVH